MNKYKFGWRFWSNHMPKINILDRMLIQMVNITRKIQNEKCLKCNDTGLVDGRERFCSCENGSDLALDQYFEAKHSL